MMTRPRLPSTDFQRAWLADGRVLEPGGPNLLMASALLALSLLRGAKTPDAPAKP